MNDFNLSQVSNLVLRKQHLTDESKTNDIVQTVKHIGGLHATIPKTPYLSMFSRPQKWRLFDVSKCKNWWEQA
jgi:hypothetical protein